MSRLNIFLAIAVTLLLFQELVFAKAETESHKFTCPSGIASQEGDKPELTFKFKSGSLYYCGQTEKVDTITYLIGGDLYSISNKTRQLQHLYTISEVESLPFNLDSFGQTFSLIEGVSIHNKLLVYSLVQFNCSQGVCKQFDICKVDNLKVDDPYKKRVLKADDPKFKNISEMHNLFLSALSGHVQAPSILESLNKNLGLDGELAEEVYELQSHLERIQLVCGPKG